MAPRKLTPKMALMMLWAVVVYLGWLVGSFLAAGTIAWPIGWAYFALLACGLVAHRLYVKRKNADLLRRRQEIGKGSKRWDIVWNLAFWPLMAMVAIVAGLDARHGWSPMPAWLWPVGALIFASALFLSGWAMGVNPHFEGTVRIQEERGHRVIDTGPYRCIRHPGYVGLALWALATPFLLLSWSAFIPAGAVAAWLVLRTALEDSTLRRELDGYAEYAKRVRSRLLPMIW
jgi:protein-S-isoprenylcysteine O-methyltransferase Ste14